MDSKTKETVLVVHGTFAGKSKHGPAKWYAPGQDFCVQLDEELAKRNSAARCWAHLQPSEDYFHWDGKNDWLSRARTATRLRNEIRRLNSQGWLVHLVGHSHGGNVIISAITDDNGATQSWFNGRVALLGTPIYRNSRDLRARSRIRLAGWLALSLIAWLALLYYSTRNIDVFAAFSPGTPTEYISLYVAATFIFASLFLLASAFGILSSERSKSKIRRSPAIMAINSPRDEAYRSLSGLRGSANPFLASTEPKPAAANSPGPVRKVKTAGVRALESATRSLSNVAEVIDSIRSSLAARIRLTLKTESVFSMLLVGTTMILAGFFWQPILSAATSKPVTAPGLSIAFLILVTLFVLAACFFRRGFRNATFLPGIALAYAIPVIWKALTGIALTVFDVVVKKGAWGLIKSLSLGINGAARSAEDILVSLEPAGDNIYLNLPDEIVEDVKKEQQPLLGKIQGILYEENLKWSPDQLRSRLEGVDFPMIHTVYYRNSECIQKVADWLEEPVQELLDDETPRETIRTVGQRGGVMQQVRETIHSPNVYKIHLVELKVKLSPPGSIWHKPLSRAQQALADLAFPQSATPLQGPPTVKRRLPPRWPPPSL